MGREIISGVFWGGILSAVAVSVASLMGTEGGVPFRVPVNGLPFSLTTGPEMVAETPGETRPELSSGSAEDTPVTADVRLPGLNDGADAEEELALLAPAEGETGEDIERDDTGSPTETASGEDAGDTSDDLPVIAETPEADNTPSDTVTADPSTNSTLADGGSGLSEEPVPTDSPTPSEGAPVIAETPETTQGEAEDVSPVETAELPESSGDENQTPALADASDEAPAAPAPNATTILAQLNAPLSSDTNLPTVAPETPVLPGALQLASLPSPSLEIAPTGPTRSSFALAAGVAAPLSPVAGAAPQVLQRVDPSTSQTTPALAAADTVPAPAREAEPPAPVLALARVTAPEATSAAPFQAALPGETPSFSSPEPDLPALAEHSPDALPFLPARRLPPEHLFASGPQAPEIVDRFFLIDPPLPSEDAPPMARASAPALAQAAQSTAPSAPAPAPRALVLAAIGAPTLSPIDATPPEKPTPEPFMRVAITGPSPYGPVTPHPDLPLLPSRSANPPPPENRTPPLFAGLLGAGSRLASAPEGAEAPVLPGAFDTVALAAPVELPASTTDQAPGITDRRGFDVALTVASLTATNGTPGLPRLGASDRRLDRVALVAPQAEPEPAPIVRTAHFEPPREATADVQVGDAPATLTAREVLQSLGVVPGPEAPAPSQAELVAMARATEIPDLPQADTAPPALDVPKPSADEATQPEQTEDRPVLAALAPEATTPSRAVASEARAEQVRVNRLPTIGQQVSEAAPASALEQHAARFENPDDLPVFSVILMENPDTAPEIDRIAGLPLPVSMAVDPSWPGASERAQAYRAAGLEVVILAAFKEGDVASTFATFRQALPQAVAVIETGPGAWSTNRAQVGDLVAELAGTGHGLITYPKGLNSARQLAERAEVPSGLVARAVEPDKGRDVQRRALERAAFKAARDGKAIVVGQAVDETLELLADWGTSRKTTQVALAPISQVLRAE